MEENAQKEREEIHQDIARIRNALNLQWTGTGAENEAEEDDDLEEDESDDDVGGDPFIKSASKDDRDLGTGAVAVGSVFTSNVNNGTDSYPGGATDVHQDSESSADSAMALNWTYQHLLKDNILKLQLMLSSNRERQSILKETLEKQGEERVNRSKNNTLSSYGIPYIKDNHGMCPPVNPDVHSKRAMQEQQEKLKPTHMWPNTEIKKLKDAIKHDALEKAMRPLMNRKEIEYSKLKNGSVEETKGILDRIKSLDQQLRETKKLSDAELFAKPSESHVIDWLKISNQVFNGKRTETECELIWKNAFHPTINSKRWTKEEDDHLTGIMSNDGENLGWDKIAETMGTGRTAFQCLQRYQTKLHPSLKTGKWESEEDNLFSQVVHSCQMPGGEVDWDQVTRYMEGRTLGQCKERWEFLHRAKKRKWTKEEDDMLINALVRFGQKWSKVAQYVPNRTQPQCRDRYLNSLDKGLKHSGWTKEEDQLLIRLVKDYGQKWTKIASFHPGRTDHMVMCRYKRLLRWQLQNKLITNVSAQGVVYLGNMKLANEMTSARKKSNAIQKEIATLERKRQAVCQKYELMTCVNESENHVPKPIQEIHAIDDQISCLKVRYRELLKVKSDGLLSINQQLQVATESGTRGGDDDMASNSDYIPRPLLKKKNIGSSTNVLTRMHNEQLRVHHELREAVEKRIGNAENLHKVMADLDKILAGKLDTFLEKEIFLKVQGLSSDIPQVELQRVSNYILSSMRIPQRKQLQICGRGRRPKNAREVKVDADLDQLLSQDGQGGNEIQRHKRGKIKLFFRDQEPLSQKPLKQQGIELLKNDPKLKGVFQIFLSALQVDLQGCLHSVTQEELVKTQCKLPVPPAMPPVTQVKLEPATDSTSQSIQDKAKVSQDCLDENLNVFKGLLQAVAAAAGLNIESSLHKPACSRPAASGAAARCYILPPLPPTITSLVAFKHLLLQRRHLMLIRQRVQPLKKRQTVTPGQPADTFSVAGVPIADSELTPQHAQPNDGGTTDVNAEDLTVKRKKVAQLVSEAQKTHEYQLLNARFASLFLWPAFLSTVYTDPIPDTPLLPQEQPKVVQPQLRPISKTGRKNNYPLMRKRKNPGDTKQTIASESVKKRRVIVPGERRLSRRLSGLVPKP